MSKGPAVSKKLSVQWHTTKGDAYVFDGQNCIAEITPGSRDQVRRRLNLMGLYAKHWRVADWGFYSDLGRR